MQHTSHLELNAVAVLVVSDNVFERVSTPCKVLAASFCHCEHIALALDVGHDGLIDVFQDRIAWELVP
jgi:hypothetical protein